jgi:hypothetical protein
LASVNACLSHAAIRPASGASGNRDHVVELVGILAADVAQRDGREAVGEFWRQRQIHFTA